MSAFAILITCGLHEQPIEALQACCHASEACNVDHVPLRRTALQQQS